VNVEPNTGNAAAIGHEVKDASVHPIVLTGVALAGLLMLVGFIVYGMFHYLATRQMGAAIPNPLEETNPQQVPPQPRVEEHPQAELQQLRAEEDRLLSTYGWVDKQKGIVRIPIDRAMELQLQRGFPVRKAAAGKDSRP
jgi:hypothetical protein